MNTYLERYNEALEQVFAEGGDDLQVSSAIREYNAFDPEAFGRWVTAISTFACVSCGALFAPVDPKANDVILCKDCLPHEQRDQVSGPKNGA